MCKLTCIWRLFILFIQSNVLFLYLLLPYSLVSWSSVLIFPCPCWILSRRGIHLPADHTRRLINQCRLETARFLNRKLRDYRSHNWFPTRRWRIRNASDCLLEKFCVVCRWYLLEHWKNAQICLWSVEQCMLELSFMVPHTFQLSKARIMSSLCVESVVHHLAYESETHTYSRHRSLTVN